MYSGKILRFGATAVWCLLVLHGCGSTGPVLVPKSAVPPASVDFTGQWLLRGGNEPGMNAGGGPGIESLPTQSNRRGRPSRSSRKSSSVHVFLETGRSLKVTQTEHAFFVSLDRSIVEEFIFGENRIVSVGPIEARRVSGWEGARYIVETLDKQGAVLREEWRLDESGDVLLRAVTIVERDKVKLSLNQAFDRQ